MLLLAFSSPQVAESSPPPAFRLSRRHFTLVVNRVDQAVPGSALGAHEVVTVCVTLDGLDVLASVEGQQFVQTRTNRQDFLGVDIDVRSLALETAQRLVNHHPRVRQAVTLALGAASQQERAHAAGLPDASGRYVWADELHGVVDRHAYSHRTTR